MSNCMVIDLPFIPALGLRFHLFFLSTPPNFFNAWSFALPNFFFVLLTIGANFQFGLRIVRKGGKEESHSDSIRFWGKQMIVSTREMAKTEIVMKCWFASACSHHRTAPWRQMWFGFGSCCCCCCCHCYWCVVQSLLWTRWNNVRFGIVSLTPRISSWFGPVPVNPDTHTHTNTQAHSYSHLVSCPFLTFIES